MRLLVFQHTPGEHPAAFADHAKAAGDVMTIVKLYDGFAIPELGDFDALLVMGGPMDVWEVEAHPWLVTEKAAIAKWISSGRPFLGVCLGHQLMVEALGGSCAKLDVPEISISNIIRCAADPVFDQFPDSFPVLKWHGVAAKDIPEGAKVLANSASCPVQAIRFGDCAWGVQFHPEITDTTITDWLSDQANWDGAVAWLGSEETARAFAKDGTAHANVAWVQSKALYGGLRAAAVDHQSPDLEP